MTSQTAGTGREPARSCAECGTRAEPGQSFCDSCGSVLGWSGAPDRSDSARPDAAASGGSAGAPAPAAGRPSRDSSGAASGRSGASGRGTGDQPGWDAFAHPGAGTGTARTGHDPATTGTAARTGHDPASAGPSGPGGGEARQDDWPESPHSDHRRERDAAARQGDAAPDGPTGQAADTRQPGPAASSDAADGTWRPDTAPESVPAGATQSRTAAAAAAGSGAVPRQRQGGSAAPAGSGAGSFHQRDTTTAPNGPATDAREPGRTDSPRPDTRWDDTADTEPVPATAPEGPRPSTGSPDSTAERARSLLIPVSDPEPRAPEQPAVAPVLPGRPVANRPQVRAPGPESDHQGGIPCPWCATLNLPDRHFCGRCAMPMARGAQTPGRQPWWRRMLGSRAAQTPWAGDRPRLRRGFGRVMNWVVGALVLALIVTLFLNIGAGVDATRDHFAKRAPVGPTSVKASRSYPGHGAGLAFDQLNNTWWGPGVSQSGEGEWVEARFDQPTRLLDLIITSGVSTKVDQLRQSALPRRIEARITTADGKTSTRTILLDQSAGGQRRKFRVGEVVAVRFILRSAYAADAKKQVSIAEIEFFGRSNSNTS